METWTPCGCGAWLCAVAGAEPLAGIPRAAQSIDCPVRGAACARTQRCSTCSTTGWRIRCVRSVGHRTSGGSDRAGRVSEALPILESLSGYAEAHRLRALGFVLQRDLAVARLEAAKAFELAPDWQATRYTRTVVNYLS